MEDGSLLPFAFAFLLLLAAAWLACAETALASAPRSAIKAAADHEKPHAGEALQVMDDFDSAITAILICTNLVHITAAAVVTDAVTSIWGLSAVTWSTLATTIVVFFAGEMLPKSLAKKYAQTVLLSTASTLLGLMKLLRPFTRALAALGNSVGRRHAEEDPELSVTEDELYDIIDDMTEEGTLDEEQGELISSALQFGDVTVESIVTPRVDLAAVSVTEDPAAVLELIRSTPHSRFPVYEGSIDNIIGVLPMRRFLRAYLNDPAAVELRTLMDETVYIHASTKVDDAMPMLNSKRVSMAVVTDNYGGTLGVVTMEDILEELVGEIWDEEDVVEETVQELGEGEYLFAAEETVADMFDRIGYEDPEENEELVNTLLGEWAYEQFAAIPQPGDSFLYHAVEVTVGEMDHNRILTLRVKLLPQEPETAEAEKEEEEE